MIKLQIEHYKLMTIDENECITELSDNQRISFQRSIMGLELRTISHRDTAIITYRGVRRTYLINNLSTKDEPEINDSRLLSRLFYFGDKAKSFCKEQNMLWLQDIEDCSQKTCEEIFARVGKLLASSNARDFRKKNDEFYRFFKDQSNEHLFCSTVCGNLCQIGRDYYLYFLHTACEDSYKEQSVLISTSTNIDRTKPFYSGDEWGHIIHYVIPKPFDDYAVASTGLKEVEKKLKKHSLPCYDGFKLYDESEYSIRGALFPSRILGVLDPSSDSFIVNPHLFTSSNVHRDIVNGLDIDQPEFEDKLKHQTNYKRGVESCSDGSFRVTKKSEGKLDPQFSHTIKS
jgi:hypothetical protein